MANKGDLSDALPADLLDNPYVERLREQYHVPALVLVFIFMLAVRLQTFGKFVTDNGVRFSGNDPWYHYREVVYTVQNWPHTMDFDPMTGYPVGIENGQFGTLFDQILATIALIVGLGNPSDHTIRLVMVLAPPVMGSLAAIPTYYVAKRLHSRLTGVVAAISLALIPGVFLSRGLVGVADHHIAEVLFLMIAAAVLMWAFDRANAETVVFELFDDRDRDALREGLLPALAAGIAAGLYLWVWPAGILFIGITAVFYTLYAGLLVWRDQTPEPVLIAGAVANVVTAGMALLAFDGMALSATVMGPVQVLFPLGTAAGCVFLAVLARQFEQHDAPAGAYPVTLAALVVGGLAALAVLTPDLFAFLKNNTMRAIGFGQHAGIMTIGEAQPLIGNGNPFQSILIQYGMLFFTALAGVGLMVGRVGRKVLAREDAATDLFTIVLFVFITLAAFTQVRFNYYLAPLVAVFAAFAVIRIFEVTKIVGQPVRELETYQWMALIMVVGLVFMPILVYPLGANSVARGTYHSPGDYNAWEEPLDWMNDNTPEYESIDQYGTYETPENGDYDYDSDVYGVMSWWDYGHWTTVTAERAPVANPFQQHAEESAQFLLAQNESEAESVVSDMEGDAQAKYVAVDWKMVTPSSKFGAPVVWHPDLEQDDMYENVYVEGENGQYQYGMTTLKQRYYESMMVRLYHYHGSAVAPTNLVVDYEQSTATAPDGSTQQVKVAPQAQPGQTPPVIRSFNNSREAQQFMQQEETAHYGGVGLHPRERVDALEHYRLVKTSPQSALSAQDYMNNLQQYAQYDQSLRVNDFTRNPAWVKVFERVPGATVKGSGAPPNATVLAQVQMNDPTQNQPFVYRQFVESDEDGEFTMTLPYSTTGYDEYGPETGHTNVSVRATGEYQFYSVQQELVVDENGNQSVSYNQWSATAHVSEGQVNGATDEPVTITLEKMEQPDQEQEQSDE